MKKINTAPISGMPEFLPEIQAKFDGLRGAILETYRRHGYLAIETPAIERLEILLAKAGGETEKQIYKVAKTGDELAQADEALRFDHTVPLARYTVEHENDLVFPFKAAQVGTSWRGERAQKGRYREFTQCDVDVVGRGSLALEYDADVIATMLDAYAAMKLTTPVKVRVSNRKILSGLLDALGIVEGAPERAEVYHVIDHAEKNPEGWLREAVEDIEITDEAVEKILQLANLRGGAEVTRALEEMGVENELFAMGVAELETVYELLESYGAQVELDLKIVRGLDYYTGTVFEFCLPEYPEVGSIGGGGRYENLAEYFTEQKLPGVGGSIGLSRLFYIIQEHNLLESQERKPVEYAVIPMGTEQNAFAMEVAEKLRAEGTSATVVYLDKRLGDKLTYAAKLAQKAIVIGEKEVETGEWQVKEFK